MVEQWEQAASKAGEMIKDFQGCSAWNELKDLSIEDMKSAMNAIQNKANTDMLQSKQFPVVEVTTTLNDGKSVNSDCASFPPYTCPPPSAIRSEVRVTDPNHGKIKEMVLAFRKDLKSVNNICTPHAGD
jgi:hypothetical protein